VTLWKVTNDTIGVRYRATIFSSSCVAVLLFIWSLRSSTTPSLRISINPLDVNLGGTNFFWIMFKYSILLYRIRCIYFHYIFIIFSNTIICIGTIQCNFTICFGSVLILDDGRKAETCSKIIVYCISVQIIVLIELDNKKCLTHTIWRCDTIFLTLRLHYKN
jgi:hypothetical protein